MGKAIYLAGKIQKNGWRHTIVKGMGDWLDNMEEGRQYLHVNWPRLECAIFDRFDYVGPYFVACDHGCYHGANQHGQLYAYDHDDGLAIGRLGMQRMVRFQCSRAISQSDIFFVWLDTLDAYGTLVEVGLARGFGKVIYIASPTFLPDLWFAYSCAKNANIWTEAPSAKEGLWHFLREEHRLAEYADHLESPIEKMFWQQAASVIEDLVPQAHIGDYRIDFAIPSKKIAIELDGHEYHKTKEQRTYDAQRERYIQGQGWQVIRFTGTEIYQDAKSCVDQTLALMNSQ